MKPSLSSYKALYKTLFALVLFDSPLSNSKVIKNSKRSLVQGVPHLHENH